MITKKIVLNKWLGDKFENGTKCDDCGKFASVMEFSVEVPSPGIMPGHGWNIMISLCPNCLTNADKEVTDAYCKKMFSEVKRKCQNM
jgi:hypothetical protein